MNWYLAAFIATVLYSLYYYALKLIGVRRLEQGRILFVQNLSLLSLAFVVLWLSGHELIVSAPLFGLAVLNSLFFVGTQVMRVRAMKSVPASLTYAVSKSGVVLVILWAWFLRAERPTFVGWIGVLLSLLALACSVWPRAAGISSAGGERRWGGGLSAAALSAALSAGTAISLKEALHGTGLAEQLSFTIVGYVTLVVAQPLVSYVSRGSWLTPSREVHVPSVGAWIVIGGVMGLLLFVAFLALASAYRTGNLVAVTLLQGNATVFATLLVWAYPGEERTWREIMALVGSGLATVAFAIG